MKKKISALLTALGLAVSLAACGAKETVNNGTDADSDVIVLRACFSTGMTGAVNNFAIEKGLYEAEGIRLSVCR